MANHRMDSDRVGWRSKGELSKLSNANKLFVDLPSESCLDVAELVAYAARDVMAGRKIGKSCRLPLRPPSTVQFLEHHDMVHDHVKADCGFAGTSGCSQ